jgi:DNA-binding response OmpR family regulator
MRFELTHNQRRALNALEHGDVIVRPTNDGIYRGAITVEHEHSGGLHIIRPDGVMRSVEDLAKLDAEREYGPLLISTQNRKVEALGQQVELTRMEFNLLWHLAGDPERVFTKDDLLEDVWRFPATTSREATTRTVDGHAGHLRRKLAAIGLVGWIRCTRGVGYRLAP